MVGSRRTRLRSPPFLSFFTLFFFSRTRFPSQSKNLHIDYLGVWNERPSNATYVKTLRKALDAAGFSSTTIVAADGSSSICNDLHGDPDYNAAVGIIGLHYPSDYRSGTECDLREWKLRTFILA